MPSHPSGERRIIRGSVIVVFGVIALLAPFAIGEWGLLFVFAFLPMALFLLGIGIIEIIRGAMYVQRNSR